MPLHNNLQSYPNKGHNGHTAARAALFVLLEAQAFKSPAIDNVVPTLARVADYTEKLRGREEQKLRPTHCFWKERGMILCYVVRKHLEITGLLSSCKYLNLDLNCSCLHFPRSEALKGRGAFKGKGHKVLFGWEVCFFFLQVWENSRVRCVSGLNSLRLLTRLASDLKWSPQLSHLF